MVAKKDQCIIKDIIKKCQRIVSKNSGIDFSSFSVNLDLIEIICFNLIQIGELVNKLSEDFINSYSDEDWRSIRGMRNRIAHGYDSVDYETVYESINVDVPHLMDYCKKILDESK